jgi:hypothetical protein
MFRVLSAMFIAALALVPAVASASGPKSGSSSHASQTTSHTTTTTTNKTINTPHYIFPTDHKGADIKIAKGELEKLGNKPFDASYKTKFGTKFDKGYFYKGKDHFHWSYRCYTPRFGCYCYWCPSASCYYYWCEPDTCFYPITYCPYHVYAWAGSYVVPNIPIVAPEATAVVPPPGPVQGLNPKQ